MINMLNVESVIIPDGDVKSIMYKDIYIWNKSATPVIKPIANSSLRDIMRIVDAYYRDEIAIDEIKTMWEIGDSFNISTSATDSNTAYSAEVAQTSPYIIVDFEHYELTNPIGNKNRNLLTLVSKNRRQNSGRPLRASNISNQGFNTTYANTWFNERLYESFETEVKERLKLCKVKIQNSSNLQPFEYDTSITLPSYFEIYGSQSAYGKPTYADGTQFPFYQTAGNRTHWFNGSGTNSIWLRSRGTTGGGFACMQSDGKSNSMPPATAYGITPMIFI